MNLAAEKSYDTERPDRKFEEFLELYEPTRRFITRHFRRKTSPQVTDDELYTASLTGIYKAFTKAKTMNKSYVAKSIAGTILDEIRTKNWFGQKNTSANRRLIREGDLSTTDTCAFERVDYNNPENRAMIRQELRTLYEFACNNLTKQEWEVIERTCIYGEQAKDVAKDYGVTAARISQIKNDSLRKIRTGLERKLH